MEGHSTTPHMDGGRKKGREGQGTERAEHMFSRVATSSHKIQFEHSLSWLSPFFNFLFGFFSFLRTFRKDP